MAYVECRTKAGYTIEVERYYTPRHYPKGERRKKRQKVSSEAQKKINTRQAEKKLRRGLVLKALEAISQPASGPSHP